MGAYSPAPVVTPELEQVIDAQIMQPFYLVLPADGLDFRGVIYAGLMLTAQGPKVLNLMSASDPETQAIGAPGQRSAEALVATADGRLAEVELVWSPKPAVRGDGPRRLSGQDRKGDPIRGIEAAEATGAVVFSRTRIENGQTVTSGGRVLGVTALGQDIAEAVANAYQAVELISWPGAWYRRDIAHRALQRNKQR